MTRAELCLGTIAVALTVTVAGCFDFDKLRRPRDGAPPNDLAGASDGSAAHDMTHVVADLTNVAEPADLLARPDLGVTTGTPTPRLIAQAWFSNFSGTTYASTTGMSKSGFEISTAGVNDGDLVVFVGSIDNGSNTVWPDPIAPGFTQVAQAYYGSDGQTFVVAYKLASHEPTKYAGTYGSGIGSSSAAISLIAVTGASTVMPVDNSLASFSSAAAMSPVNGGSTGLVTTVPGCTLLLASGVDWSAAGGTNTFTLPSRFASLSQLGDHGDLGWDWTSQQVSWAPQASAGATGAVNWSASGSHSGQSWTVLVAVAP
jgi:hypothetical protein